MNQITMKHTPGPWDVDKTAIIGVGPWVIGRDGYVIGTTRLEADARLIAMAPEMAEYLSRMKCCYKAPEVAHEICGHCIVCRAKGIVA
jgi:hypothetical protein